MQEPIDHTTAIGQREALPDYRPDEDALLFFRRTGRVGFAIAPFYLFMIGYQLYLARSFWRLYNRTNQYRLPAQFHTEYLVRFCFSVIIILLGLVTLVLMLRASRSLLKYGSEADNMNLGRPARHLYTWFICLLAGIIINSAFYFYLLVRSGAVSGIA